MLFCCFWFRGNADCIVVLRCGSDLSLRSRWIFGMNAISELFFCNGVMQAWLDLEAFFV